MGSIDYHDSFDESEQSLFSDSQHWPFQAAEHSKIRHSIPVLNDRNTTYLNAAFQQPMNAKVHGALTEYLHQATTHPHPKPIWQKTAVDSLAKLARYLNVPETSVVFTRDTTEGLNLFQRSLNFKAGDNVVLLDVEHPNQAYGWLALQELGLEVRQIDTGKDTFADAETFAPYVNERTIAIGISSVMFHSGQMNDVKSICARYRPRGVHVLADVTQQVGVSPMDLSEWNVSAAAFSCHKGLGCPSGLAAFYINPDVLESLRPTPPIVGAGAISNLSPTLLADPDVRYHLTTKRYEHLNVSLIGAVALRASLSYIVDDIGIEKVDRHLRLLGKALIQHCDRLKVEVVGSRDMNKRSPHIYVLKLMSPEWQHHFQEHGIFVSHYRCGVRVSFGFYNDVSDVLKIVEAVERGLQKGIPPS